MVPAPRGPGSTPPCTAIVAVGEFEVVDTAAGLSVTSEGKLGSAIGPGLGGMVGQGIRGARLARDRKRSRMERLFEEQLRQALADNARALGADTASPNLTVYGLLHYSETLEIDVHSAGEPEKRRRAVVDVDFVVLDEANHVVTEGILPAVTTWEGERQALAEAARALLPALVRRSATVSVAFAQVFSREIRRGRRAARKQNWLAAEAHWQRASESADEVVKRAGHFNLGVLYELQGNLEQALFHHEAAAAITGVRLGYAYAATHPTAPLVTPNEGDVHVQRLRQRLAARACTANADTDLPAR